MSYYYIYKCIVKPIKKLFGLENLSITFRKKIKKVERLFYHRKYTAHELVEELVRLGLKPGQVIIVHSAMSSFYNYVGTPDELIDELLRVIGIEGTLCMPAYPDDKNNPEKVFDVRIEPSAAGLLTETFRKRAGVKRSLNKLHSVCALGPKADYIIGEHHLSRTCFDEHSPFYKIYELGGMSISLGLPSYYIGTCEHVPESILCEKLAFFRDKFVKPVTFSYIDAHGKSLTHTMLTGTRQKYVHHRNTKLIDQNFDPSKYSRQRFSNLRITTFDVRYLVDTITRLALEEGKTIYSHPKFYK